MAASKRTSFYNFLRRELPDAGAQQYAFYPGFTLPLYGLPGPGTPYSFRWAVTQPEQVYYNQAQSYIGLVGVQAGQMALTELLDTRYLNGVAGASG